MSQQQLSKRRSLVTAPPEGEELQQQQPSRRRSLVTAPAEGEGLQRQQPARRRSLITAPDELQQQQQPPRLPASRDSPTRQSVRISPTAPAAVAVFGHEARITPCDTPGPQLHRDMTVEGVPVSAQPRSGSMRRMHPEPAPLAVTPHQPSPGEFHPGAHPVGRPPGRAGRPQTAGNPVRRPSGQKKLHYVFSPTGEHGLLRPSSAPPGTIRRPLLLRPLSPRRGPLRAGGWAASCRRPSSASTQQSSALSGEEAAGPPRPPPVAALPPAVLSHMLGYAAQPGSAAYATTAACCRAWMHASLDCLRDIELVPVVDAPLLVDESRMNALCCYYRPLLRGRRVRRFALVSRAARETAAQPPAVSYRSLSMLPFCFPCLEHLDLRGVTLTAHVRWADALLPALATATPQLNTLKVGAALLCSWRSRWWAALPQLRCVVVGGRRLDGAADAWERPPDHEHMAGLLGQLTTFKVWCPVPGEWAVKAVLQAGEAAAGLAELTVNVSRVVVEKHLREFVPKTAPPQATGGRRPSARPGGSAGRRKSNRPGAGQGDAEVLQLPPGLRALTLCEPRREDAAELVDIIAAGLQPGMGELRVVSLLRPPSAPGPGRA